MPRKEGQKLKLLYIVKILSERTDENHPMSTGELIKALEAEGISCERKSIYDDIAKLNDFGYEILHASNRSGGGYALVGREFELPELKLLVDAVQSSRFITTKKSRELIAKLEGKASRYEKSKLQRQVYVSGRIKTENESIYYNIDSIHRGIQENRQIRFTYMEWNLKKQLVPRENGNRTVSPWALIWQDENYYLAAYDSADAIMKHFRVDKMGSVEVTDKCREGMEQFEKTDPAGYTNKTFGMYGGDEETVTIEFENRLIGVVMDRFGKDADIRPMENGTFRLRTKVVVSGQFYGWLSGIGPGAMILSPEVVKKDYFAWLERILNENRNRTE